jgi:uncharacterized protein (DUF1697 family)
MKSLFLQRYTPLAMPVLIALLRGVNVGGHNKIKMEVLRDLCVSLKCETPQTLLQSGNVVFKTSSKNTDQLAKSLETAIERKLGFRPNVLARTVPELRDAIARNPFANRSGIDPGKLVVTFLGAEPNPQARKDLLAMDIAPEELHVKGRELFIYFPNGQARPKLSWPRVEKIIGPAYTSRNWNTVTKLLQLAGSLQGRPSGAVRRSQFVHQHQDKC